MIRARDCLAIALALVLGAAVGTAAGAQPAGAAPRGAGFMARTGSFLGLLGAEKVQKELKLSDAEVAKTQEIGKKLGAEMREPFAGLREIQDRRKAWAKMTELLQQFDEKARGQLRDVLSQEQLMRLYQVRLQVRGPVYGLNNSWIAERLKLTDEQKKKGAKIDAAMQEKIYELLGGLRDLTPEQRREKMAEVGEKYNKIRNEADKQALGLLTAEQKEALEKLKGEKFEL